ncbi:MAG: LysM peptidoglycan-binding domain-containing protein, partial [Acidimicrobiales bacterium]|nr:LysM peptidoglycan-binding domain-containing protein [Acidimicrobiales bacterium]
PPVYVVRRGDTLWSIAGALGAAADADPRELVDALSERTDGRALQPGQRIDLSGLPGVDG